MLWSDGREFDLGEVHGRYFWSVGSPKARAAVYLDMADGGLAKDTNTTEQNYGVVCETPYGSV